MNSITKDRHHWFLWMALLVMGVALAFYLPLFEVSDRNVPVRYGFKTLIPFALGHAALLALISHRTSSKLRAALVFWGLSLMALCVIGGMWQTTGILVAVIFSGLLIVVGDFAQDWILPKQSRSWGVSLALGILASSVTGALLAAFHALRFSSVAALFLAAAYCGWLRRHLLLKRVQQECEEFSSRAKFPTLLALEGLFLVTVFVWVSASPPESRYDAMIRYWPYLKLLKLESGFFDLPYQWNYIIPQGGLSYAACFYLLFGEAGLR